MSEQQTPRNDDVGPERARRLPSQSEDMAKAQARIAQNGWRRAQPSWTISASDAPRIWSGRASRKGRERPGWLPVVDNLERALEHASSDPEQIIAGVRAVHQQALSVLAGLGFPRRDDTGRAFDPALHEAIGTIADGELRPGTVARVVRPGYGLDTEILRPAAVVVATGSD